MSWLPIEKLTTEEREPPTLRLKKLIENLSEYKFDIYFLKGKDAYIRFSIKTS